MVFLKQPIFCIKNDKRKYLQFFENIFWGKTSTSFIYLLQTKYINTRIKIISLFQNCSFACKHKYFLARRFTFYYSSNIRIFFVVMLLNSWNMDWILLRYTFTYKKYRSFWTLQYTFEKERGNRGLKQISLERNPFIFPDGASISSIRQSERFLLKN